MVTTVSVVYFPLRRLLCSLMQQMHVWMLCIFSYRQLKIEFWELGLIDHLTPLSQSFTELHGSEHTRFLVVWYLWSGMCQSVESFKGIAFVPQCQHSGAHTLNWILLYSWVVSSSPSINSFHSLYYTTCLFASVWGEGDDLQCVADAFENSWKTLKVLLLLLLLIDFCAQFRSIACTEFRDSRWH